MKKTNDFKIRIADGGSDTFSAGYKTMRDKDALNLARDICFIMSKNFIPEGSRGSFLAHLSYSLLHDVLKKDFNPDNIIKNIKNGKYFLDKWKIRDKTETQTSASPTSKEGMELWEFSLIHSTK